MYDSKIAWYPKNLWLGSLLFCQVREAFVEKMLFELRLEKQEGINQAMRIAWNILGKRYSVFKGPDLRKCTELE